jgi:uncharacterized protein YdaU (DUF1376 family)
LGDVARFPALPLFTDSWIADTKHLSRSERGLYMDLIILIWRTPLCRIPDDRQWIARKLGIAPDDDELAKVIDEFCSHPKGSGKWLVQKRLQREFQYLTSKRALRSKAAKVRWEKQKKDANAMLTPPHPTPPNNNPPKPPLAKGGPLALQSNGKGRANARPRQLSTVELIEGARALRTAREKEKS